MDIAMVLLDCLELRVEVEFDAPTDKISVISDAGRSVARATINMLSILVVRETQNTEMCITLYPLCIYISNRCERRTDYCHALSTLGHGYTYIFVQYRICVAFTPV